ncbi:hypothetical protein IKH79_00975 [Candidatus Saccharibacteria bacterium]|nr:hypothetical protein [Candidatus Saccharibacteria bacterium]
MSEEPDLTAEELEEARAEEEFISAPEDRVNNPLVPAGAGTIISSGDFTHDDFTGGGDVINNETNMKGEIVENPDEPKSIFDKPKAAAPAAPAEDGAPIFGKKKEAKKEEPAAAPAPAPAPAEQPVVANAAATGAAPAPKKKSKAGLIITICVLAVLLIGGGVAAFLLLVMRESPETMVNDAVAKIYESENLGITSKIDVESGDKTGTFDFDIKKSGENLKLAGKLEMEGMKVDIDAIQYKSETYVKFSGLSKLDIKNFMDADSISTMGSQMKMVNAIIKAMSGAIDDNWIKLDLDMISNLIPKSDGCSFDVQSLLSADASKLKDAYKDNAFIKRDESADVKEEDGVKYIKVKVDQEKSKNFAKAMVGDGASKCVEDDKKEDEKESTIVLGVKPWSHDLSVVRINDGKKDYELKFNYDKADIEKPSSAKSLLTLGSEIEKALKTAMNEYAEDYTKELCQSTYGSYGSAYVEACVDTYLPQMKKQFENFDMSQLFGPLFSSLLGGGSSVES